VKETSLAQLHKRATGLMKKGRYLDAIELFRNQSLYIKEDWRALWDLGWCYYKLEKFGEAGKYFDRADAISSRNATCKWARGLIYIKKRKYKKAEEVLLESLRLKERFHTRIALALAYLSQDKVELAEKTHLDGIKIGTRLTERYESYAAFLSDVGREAEADTMNRKVQERQSIQ
jgi:tetratricopeptide (TPR) repeat protein